MIYIQLWICYLVALEFRIFTCQALIPVICRLLSEFISFSSGSESANVPRIYSTSDINSRYEVVSSSSCWVGGWVSNPAMTPSGVNGICSGLDGTRIPKGESGACWRCLSSTCTSLSRSWLGDRSDEKCSESPKYNGASLIIYTNVVPEIGQSYAVATVAMGTCIEGQLGE